MLVWGDFHHNAVGDIEVLALAHVLNAVHQFACDTFLAEIVGDGDVECHGDIAIVGNEPAWNVFADHLHVSQFHHSLFAIECEGYFAVFLELCDLRLLQRGECLCGSLHILAEFRAKFLKVGFDALHQNASIATHIVDTLHIHFAHNEVGNGFDILLLRFVEHRNHDSGERLLHLQILLAAQ